MSEVDRLSQGPSQVRKSVRAPPMYRNDANFGRASGKMLNLRNVARDSDGFEDFGAYLNDAAFLSPPPSIPSKPKPKNPLKKSTTSIRATFEYDDDTSILDESVLGRRAAPEPPKKSSQTRTLPVTTTTSTSRLNRPATHTTSAVDFDSIPEPSTKRKTLAQSSSSKAASSSSTNRPATTKVRSSQSTSTTSRKATATAKSSTKGKQPAALSTIAEDEDDDDDMDERDENGDSNMSLASLVDENQGAESHAGRFNQDDDDSGTEDFGLNGDDDDGGMDVDEPERDPTPPRSKAIDKVRRNRVETPSDDEIAEPPVGRDDEETPPQDDDGQFDVGGDFDDEPQQEEEEEEEREPSESPRSKHARLANEKKEKEKEKAKQKREPLKQKDPNAQPKKTKRVFEPQSDDDDDTGLRRGKRHRYAPLQWWRGEHAITRRPRPGEAPVLIVSEIVRVPEEQPEPLSKKHRRRGTTKPPSSRNNSKQGEVWVENPEEGWDAETDQNAMVIDYDTKQEMEKVIAQTAAMLDPKQPLNSTYAFQKVFSDGDFVAGGVMEIPVGGKKPSKPARDNTYLFYCIEGAVRVMVHRSTFVIARNGMFMVPRGNQYYLENIGDRDCKLFFAQARKVTERMVPSPTKRASALPAGRDASASQTPRPVARAGPSTASASPSKTKKAGTSSKR